MVGRGVPTRRDKEFNFDSGASRTPPPTGDVLHEGIAKSNVGVVGRGVPTRRDGFENLVPDCDGADAFASRKRLDHRGPLRIDVSDAVYFITIAAAERGGKALKAHADEILEAARHYQSIGKWFLYLLLVMPDHLHMLVHVSSGRGVPTRRDKEVNFYNGASRTPPPTLSRTIGEFKGFLAKRYGIRFQANFFDTRIRDAAHYAEKWNYICRNPVAKGLVATAREWPYSVAYDPSTGMERSHR